MNGDVRSVGDIFNLLYAYISYFILLLVVYGLFLTRARLKWDNISFLWAEKNTVCSLWNYYIIQFSIVRICVYIRTIGRALIHTFSEFASVKVTVGNWICGYFVALHDDLLLYCWETWYGNIFKLTKEFVYFYSKTYCYQYWNKKDDYHKSLFAETESSCVSWFCPGYHALSLFFPIFRRR